MRGKPSNVSSDTVILGAGAAGLAAAVELTAAGREVLVLEARERIGGRILTRRDFAPGLPAELGAEFIHGTSAATFDWLHRAGDLATDAAHERWMRDRRGLRRSEPLFTRLQQRLAQLRRPRADETLDVYLGRHRHALTPALRRLACALAEGFDAADTTQLSASEVLEEWRGAASTEAPTFRPARGFGALVDSMHQALPAGKAAVWRGTVVNAVHWRKGRVEIEALRQGRPVRVDTARLIVTLPLGVLMQAAATPGAVRFDPPLGQKATACRWLAMGPVVKLLLHFERPFWEELDDGRYRSAAFFFAPGTAFPTFWTSLPLRSSMLVAWSGGPSAAKLAGRSREDLLQQACVSLRGLFGRRDYCGMLESCLWHDWQADPYARGAYSYVLAGGADARKALAAPVQDTLYFAGEACDTSGEAGTVGGAIVSGQRAAQRLLARLARRRT